MSLRRRDLLDLVMELRGGWGVVLRTNDVFFYEGLREGGAALYFLRHHLRENSSSDEGRMGI